MPEHLIFVRVCKVYAVKVYAKTEEDAQEQAAELASFEVEEQGTMVRDQTVMTNIPNPEE